MELNTRPCKRGFIAPRRPGNRACLCDACRMAANERSREYTKERRATDPEWNQQKNKRNASLMRKWMSVPENRAARNAANRKYHVADPRGHMIYSARARARKLNVPFNLKRDDFVIPEFCPALGILLKVGDGKLSDASPTLDRRIPELGYVPGNVCVISHRANRIKNNSMPDELMAVALWSMRNG